MNASNGTAMEKMPFNQPCAVKGCRQRTFERLWDLETNKRTYYCEAHFVCECLRSKLEAIESECNRIRDALEQIKATLATYQREIL